MGQASVNRLPASVDGHGHGKFNREKRERRENSKVNETAGTGGQIVLIEAPVIDGVVINMPDCPYQGAQQAAWQCGYIAGSKSEDCEPGPVFGADDNLRSAWVQGYVLAYYGNGRTATTNLTAKDAKDAKTADGIF